jgi:membrane fusion protein (multidrug efflux system)
MSNPSLAASNPPAAAGNGNGNGKRKRALIIVAVIVVAALLVWALYWFFDLRFYESTDDAYVSGDVVAITSREAGTVTALYADNTQYVHRGQLLVQLDPADAQIEMKAAKADLARTVRGVRGQFAKADALRAQIAQARVALARADADYSRRAAAAGNGAVSGEELAHAKDAAAEARSAVAAAQGQLGETLATISGTTVTDNPDVLAAEARLRRAALDLARTKILAPVDGVVGERSAQLGQHIAAGTPLMVVVPLNHLWVDANFKEVQISDIRVGQKVTLTTDIYGGGVTFHGKIAGLAPGSGNAFALLPPQNASGNWIKIVQRVPVRVAIDPKDLARDPLRVGLSADAEVDIRDTSGPLLSARSLVHQPPAQTDNAQKAAVDALIAKILTDNGGKIGADKTP